MISFVVLNEYSSLVKYENSINLHYMCKIKKRTNNGSQTVKLGKNVQRPARDT